MKGLVHVDTNFARKLDDNARGPESRLTRSESSCVGFQPEVIEGGKKDTPYEEQLHREQLAYARTRLENILKKQGEPSSQPALDELRESLSKGDLKTVIAEYLTTQLTGEIDTFLREEASRTGLGRRALRWAMGNEKLSFTKNWKDLSIPEFSQDGALVKSGVATLTKYGLNVLGRVVEAGTSRLPSQLPRTGTFVDQFLGRFKVVRGVVQTIDRGLSKFSTRLSYTHSVLNEAGAVRAINVATKLAERFVNSLKTKSGVRMGLGFVLTVSGVGLAATGQLPLAGIALGARAAMAGVGSSMLAEGAMTRKDIHAHTQTERDLTLNDTFASLANPEYTAKAGDELKTEELNRAGRAGYGLGETVQAIAAAKGERATAMQHTTAFDAMLTAEVTRRTNDLLTVLSRPRSAEYDAAAYIAAHAQSVRTAFRARLESGKADAAHAATQRHVMAGLIGTASALFTTNLSVNRFSHLFQDTLAEALTTAKDRSLDAITEVGDRILRPLSPAAYAEEVAQSADAEILNAPFEAFKRDVSPTLREALIEAKRSNDIRILYQAIGDIRRNAGFVEGWGYDLSVENIHTKLTLGRYLMLNAERFQTPGGEQALYDVLSMKDYDTHAFTPKGGEVTSWVHGKFFRAEVDELGNVNKVSLAGQARPDLAVYTSLDVARGKLGFDEARFAEDRHLASMVGQAVERTQPAASAAHEAQPFLPTKLRVSADALPADAVYGAAPGQTIHRYNLVGFNYDLMSVGDKMYALTHDHAGDHVQRFAAADQWLGSPELKAVSEQETIALSGFTQTMVLPSIFRTGQTLWREVTEAFVGGQELDAAKAEGLVAHADHDPSVAVSSSDAPTLHQIYDEFQAENSGNLKSLDPSVVKQMGRTILSSKLVDQFTDLELNPELDQAVVGRDIRVTDFGLRQDVFTVQFEDYRGSEPVRLRVNLTETDNGKWVVNQVLKVEAIKETVPATTVTAPSVAVEAPAEPPVTVPVAAQASDAEAFWSQHSGIKPPKGSDARRWYDTYVPIAGHPNVAPGASEGKVELDENWMHNLHHSKVNPEAKAIFEAELASDKASAAAPAPDSSPPPAFREISPPAEPTPPGPPEPGQPTEVFTPRAPEVPDPDADLSVPASFEDIGPNDEPPPFSFPDDDMPPAEPASFEETDLQGSEPLAAPLSFPDSK